MIGARIYYVVFAWDYYKDNLLSIFNTRNGGMAISGGVIGAFLTLLIYGRIKKINPFRLGDLCVPGLILGQIIGRWGNFMNQMCIRDRGSKVTLKASAGTQGVEVPNVVNLTFDEANTQLVSKGFLVKKTENYSDTVESGRVISQTPSRSEEHTSELQSQR